MHFTIERCERIVIGDLAFGAVAFGLLDTIEVCRLAALKLRELAIEITRRLRRYCLRKLIT
jgi:hypothetical protein